MDAAVDIVVGDGGLFVISVLKVVGLIVDGMSGVSGNTLGGIVEDCVSWFGSNIEWPFSLNWQDDDARKSSL